MAKKSPTKKAAARAAQQEQEKISTTPEVDEEGHLNDHEHLEFQARFTDMLSCLNIGATAFPEFTEAVQGAHMKLRSGTGFDKKAMVQEQVS